jgi:uncharacterized protein (DUF1330 family)
MKTQLKTALSLAAGVALGAAAVQTLHAQAKPPAYVVGEIDVHDADRYFKEYVPPAVKAVVDGGAKYVVRNGKSRALYGAPPKALAIMRFDSVEKAEAAFASQAYRDAKAIGDKYATFRIYLVEGLE